MQHRYRPGNEETKGLIEAESAGIAHGASSRRPFAFLTLGLPYSSPRETLMTQGSKIAALLKPLGKTGLYGDANKGKSKGKGKGKKGC